MGLLVPENFPMRSLANSEERLVVEALRDRLTDGWLVIPNVGLTGQRDRQMDIVIAHERDGIAVIGSRPARIARGVVFNSGRNGIAPAVWKSGCGRPRSSSAEAITGVCLATQGKVSAW